jgi:hypothetical protein
MPCYLLRNMFFTQTIEQVDFIRKPRFRYRYAAQSELLPTTWNHPMVNMKALGWLGSNQNQMLALYNVTKTEVCRTNKKHLAHGDARIQPQGGRASGNTKIHAPGWMPRKYNSTPGAHFSMYPPRLIMTWGVSCAKRLLRDKSIWL